MTANAGGTYEEHTHPKSQSEALTHCEKWAFQVFSNLDSCSPISALGLSEVTDRRN